MDLRRRVLDRLRPQRPAAASEPEPALTSPADQAILDRVREHTMTSPERLLALIDAVRHCQSRGLAGSFAECGVWRGGSVLAMILTLQELGDERDIYLYDTFEGMTEPTEHDVSALDPPALETWNAARAGDSRPWSELFDAETFNQDRVRSVVLSSGYPADRVHLVRGPVERTLHEQLPGPLALLRLDTDWYESTRVELEQLYPALADGGVLIIDDYGHWEGARKAVDEYFEALGRRPLFSRIDYTCRMAVKD